MRNTRGITPIISVILLLMMTVAVAGLAWVWLQGMTSSVMDTTGNMTQTQMKQMLTIIDLADYGLECNSAGVVQNILFQVFNRGSSTINVNSILLNGKMATISSTNKQISAGAIGTMNISQVQSILSGFNATNDRAADVMVSASEGYAKKTLSLSGTRCNLA